jgi:hypothetical protein
LTFAVVGGGGFEQPATTPVASNETHSNERPSRESRAKTRPGILRGGLARSRTRRELEIMQRL